MSTIPKKLQPHINSAFADGKWLTMATVLADGFPQISPRGSAQVYDDEHMSTWERGTGKTAAEVHDGTKATFFYANLGLKAEGMAFVRIYGTAEVYKEGPVYDEVWKRLIEPERKLDPERKGFAVLVKVERVQDLKGNPITD